VTGLVAVLIALVSKGFVIALIVTAVVVTVQQLEGNVLEPLLMSRSVRLHPVAVLVAITIGVEIAGIVGALFAVPLLAMTRAALRPSVEEPSGDSVS
jgi:predicted PurR-regulated permease PerM